MLSFNRLLLLTLSALAASTSAESSCRCGAAAYLAIPRVNISAIEPLRQCALYSQSSPVPSKQSQIQKTLLPSHHRTPRRPRHRRTQIRIPNVPDRSPAYPSQQHQRRFPARRLPSRLPTKHHIRRAKRYRCDQPRPARLPGPEVIFVRVLAGRNRGPRRSQTAG